MTTEPPTAAEVIAATAEAGRIERLNAPTMAINREIREENAIVSAFFEEMLCKGAQEETVDFAWVKRFILPEFLRTQVPLPYVLDEKSRNVLRREAELQAVLRNRTPEEWLERIDAIPTNFRLAIASVVWWDYFSEREVKHRWPHLDRYVDAFFSWRKCHDAPHEVIQQYLAQIGYTPYQVATRLIGAP